MTRIGIDTGGTFTDAVTEGGAVLKRPTATRDPAATIAEAVERLAPDGPVELRHGTTVATNAVLERKLARVGVLVNRGFRDLLLIGRQARPQLYALEPRKPWLPTGPELCAEIPGRLGPDGGELEPFDLAACRRAGAALVRRGAEALAVVLLHSYRNPAHEQRAAEALAGLGVPVTLSSGPSPEFREVERGLTAVVNSGLRPPAGSYLGRLRAGVGERTGVRIMTSEAGLCSAGDAALEPARLLVSGPAAGVVAARVYGDAAGERRLLSLDMGGTSTDVAFLDAGLPRAASLEVAGLTIRLPSLPIHTVGAGGGSLAELDEGGALRVGPESAGADPGPAAYGKSDRLTVTDAHLLLGHIAPELFAAGAASLHFDPALAAAERLARRAGLRLRELLEGVLKIADAAMARALRGISLEKGRDPRDAALLVFGGAGGLHGVSLARALGIRTVLVPPEAGVLAARGLLWTRPARTRARSLLLDHVPPSKVRQGLLRPLLEELRETFLAEGAAARQLRVSTWVDLRYRGQSFEVEVPEAPDPVEAFHRRHAERFGFSDRDRPVELVAVRARVEVEEPAPALARVRPRRQGRLHPSFLLRPVVRGLEPTPVYDRAELRAGDVIAGPAICADGTATVRLDAVSRARVHPTGTLVLEAGGAG